MLKKLLLIISLVSLFDMNAQELNCQVSIITDARLEVTTTEQQALKQLEEVLPILGIHLYTMLKILIGITFHRFYLSMLCL